MADKDKKQLEATKSVAKDRGGWLTNPFDRELERFFGDRWPRLFDWNEFRHMPGMQVPKVDVVDRESEVVARAELPGVSKENIEISITGNHLTIKATSKQENTDEEGDYHRREIAHGYVTRTVALPAEVDSDGATAKLVDGVLEIVVPKVAKAKRQKIEIGA
ncbi:MAG: Hsp20/alpha crystallin family protein [Pseudomonadales bacterium]|nr:Hsp20/alpha crystallin family protein [Pseudomonadales bacterium]MCP5185636.1 Hsp20/alpha crystallin family protein [Pseudomonadales bacterium]